MKKTLSNVGNTIKDKFHSLTKIFSGTGKQKKGYRSYSRKAAGRPNAAASGGPRAASGKTPVLGAPGTPIRNAAPAGRPAPASRVSRRAGAKNPAKGKGFSFNFANKKRFSIIVGCAAAAVLIPVIVASANGGTNNTARAAEPSPSPVVAAALENGVQPASEEGLVPLENVDASPTPTPTATPEPTPTPKPYLTLEPETHHEDVKKLQQRLMELNYMENDEPTDYYGPQTQLAVGYFQRKHELPIDGAAGPQTQDLLFSENAKVYTVTVGAEGLDVENIQNRLEELGYPVGVTGYFGTETESAVKYFQRMNGLDDDGSVGFYTKDILFSEDAEPALEQEKKSSGSGKKSSGSGNGGGGGGSAPAANPGSVEAFVSAALAQQGKPYVLGGKGPDVFDCSGLVYYALNASGNSIGYMTSGGWAGSGYATVGWDGMQRGDVICFSGHVGIYLGDGTMVDASSSNGCVVVRGMGSWARNNFICAKRPL